MESWRHVWPVETICRVMRISPRGYRSWRSRPISQRCRTDMKVLAHIREQYSLSLGSYGRPRMTMELKEAGLAIGERRVGRLMKINGIKPVRTRRHKVTTDSHHRLGVAANWLDGDFVAAAPNQKWVGDITYVPTGAKRILDVGCAMGCFGEELKRCRAAEVWGVEPDAAE